MNYIWCAIILLSVIFSFICGSTEGLSSAIIASGKQSVEFLLSVLGVFCFWGGIMNTFIAVSITVSLLYLIPFENAFITFSTPEKAFHYTNSWDIDNIVSGTETSFVIASKNNVNTYKIVPKTQKGWKISSALATKDMFQYFCNGISIHIYRYKNSSDYYIAVFDTDGGQINITDNRGSNFISVIQNQSADIEPVYHYYACINNMDSEYVITLNGEDIKLPITKYS